MEPRSRATAVQSLRDKAYEFLRTLTTRPPPAPCSQRAPKPHSDPSHIDLAPYDYQPDYVPCITHRTSRFFVLALQVNVSSFSAAPPEDRVRPWLRRREQPSPRSDAPPGGAAAASLVARGGLVSPPPTPT
eukprot:CAMPEP_0181210910 /NCGR_PEP_ID=MMETSP1096-20121128/23497_1 /TAXON_ID=156174 ORGANISM="Chrysochromulina ericina, Strain CCMP281" /NCGR_SAMPLE_ID=MMETSP1096 /ASSEMBLY_ACC=CAM_ASM_000453 /LENGTH=130 /DNA_ID=CAMNT_0023302261 /DNA_START=170 /DNA_END=559 /DNA_ORIENTATION=+